MQHTTVTEIAALGHEINRNQYRIVRLAARYDRELDWFRQGYATPSLAIARELDIHTSTAREWVRVGHSLDVLPQINNAFATNEISYAKVRILTRYADPETEAELLELAHDYSANRLTAEVAKHLAENEDDNERDQRQHELRSVTVYTDADGMLIIRAGGQFVIHQGVDMGSPSLIKVELTDSAGAPVSISGATHPIVSS